MDDPSSYNFVDMMSSPGVLFALGFTFFVLTIGVGVGEAIFFNLNSNLLSKNRYAKHLLEQPRLYKITLLALTTLFGFSLSITVLAFLELHQKLNLLISFILTVPIVFLAIETGRILPKLAAVKNPDQNFQKATRVLRFLFNAAKPLTFSFSKIDYRLSQKINQTNQLREELRDSLERSVAPEEESEEQKKILKGIVTFSTLRVNQVMKGRADIAAVNIGMNFHELLQKIDVYGFSRIPVFKNLTDQLEGVLYSKDLLPFLEQDDTFEWQKLLRPGFFVSENERLDSLLKDFQEKRIHIALVYNEQKRISGIITMEDVIEEIIGDINKEFDETPDI